MYYVQSVMYYQLKIQLYMYGMCSVDTVAISAEVFCYGYLAF